MHEAIGIAGTGRIAQALGRALAEAGERVVALAGRDGARTHAAAVFAGEGVEPVLFELLPQRARHILIAVADDALEAVARRLAAGGMRGGVALHTCGSRAPDALEALARAGVSCGVLHPLQTVAGAEQGVTALPGSTFAVAGGEQAVAWAEEIVAVLKGTAIRVDGAGMPLYHAAAVMASNYVVGLIDAAAMLMAAAGIDGETALAALGPLVRAGVRNALALGPAEALTGPIERGDVETIARHLRSLASAPPEAGALYRAAGLYVTGLARRGGLSEKKAAEIGELLRRGR